MENLADANQEFAAKYEMKARGELFCAAIPQANPIGPAPTMITSFME